MAENHPVGFRWAMQAKQRGAKIIHVDPRFTRTSAVADIHAPIRAGTDIAFLGGLIRYVFEHERYFKEYVQAYTNASAIISDDYQDTEDPDGLFSGWEHGKAQYDTTVGLTKTSNSGTRETHQVPESHAEKASTVRTGQPKIHERDPTLENPHCVFQILKRHYERYTPEMVEEVCGIPRSIFRESCRNDLRQFGPRSHYRFLLRRGLDASLDRGADDPLRLGSATAARQRRPPGRRHHGSARTCHHSRFDRHPDAL